MAINPDPTLLRAKPDKASLDGFIEMLKAAWTYNSTSGQIEFAGYSIGWHLNKDASGQLDLGTSAELVTWVSADAAAYVDGVTFIDDDDSITILTAGKYYLSATLRWTAAVSDQDGISMQIRVDGTSVLTINTRMASGDQESFSVSGVVDLSVGGVLTVYGANTSNGGRGDLDGTENRTFFSGARVG